MKRHALALLATAIAALVVAGCGGADDTAGGGSSSSGAGGAKAQLSLVAYSTPQVVYDEIIPAFRKTPAGSGVTFRESFGASGDQSRAVEAGLPADLVALSLEPDVNRLVDAGIIAPDWADTPNKGLISKSVVAFVVRKGNPKNIRTWDDLLKPGVKVLTPNPFTSGGAKWNMLAAYGAKSGGGENPEAGLKYLSRLVSERVAVQDKSAREALQNFTAGTGDVLLAYENEAITAQKKGQKLDYVVPDQTILIENPVAVTKSSKNPDAAQAFLDFALSPSGQESFAKWGYRPVDDGVLKQNAATFPTPRGLFTIRDLGGWKKVNAEFFDPDTGSVAKIQEAAGVSTAK